MSDERLAEIRRMASRAEVSMMASSDVAVRDLLAEITAYGLRLIPPAN